MNTLAETTSTELSAVATCLTWTGLAPNFAITNENASLLLSYCGGLSSATIWVATDVGVWKRDQLRRLYTVGSDQYNEAVGSLYRELSEYMPSVQSGVSWRSYINVAERVPYESRVAGCRPAVYIPALTLEPDAWDSYLLAVQEGEHKSFLAQLYGKRAIGVAQTNGNGHVPPDTDDDVPYSSSGPGVQAEAPEWVEEYERDTDYPDSQLDSELMDEVRALVMAVLCEEWTVAVGIAERLEGRLE